MRPGAFLRTGSQKPLSVSLCAVRHRDTDGRRQQGRNADLFHQKYAGVYDLPPTRSPPMWQTTTCRGNTSGSNLTDCGSSLSWTPSGLSLDKPRLSRTEQKPPERYGKRNAVHRTQQGRLAVPPHRASVSVPGLSDALRSR